MKKIYPLIIGLTFLILTLIIFVDNKSKKVNKAIFVKQSYNYLYKNNETVNINMYLNDQNNYLTNVDSYLSIYVKNNSENKKLSLNLLNIEYSHEETYLKEKYYMYTLKFAFPNLINDFNIKNAYLELNIVNDKSYTFNIGEFNLIYINQKEEIPWETIDSKRDNIESLNINQVLIETSENININEVSINNINNLKYSYVDNLLIINIDENEYYLNNFPILIKSNNKTYVLYNHMFVKDFDLLNNQNITIYTYEVN